MRRYITPCVSQNEIFICNWNYEVCVSWRRNANICMAACFNYRHSNSLLFKHDYYFANQTWSRPLVFFMTLHYLTLFVFLHQYCDYDNLIAIYNYAEYKRNLYNKKTIVILSLSHQRVDKQRWIVFMCQMYGYLTHWLYNSGQKWIKVGTR